MAGEIEEAFRFDFQADILHSGSISFGRFEPESLSWERRSIFSHNRYLEEVERYSKPGSVTEKKAYFEAHFRRKALLKQSSSECQNGKESSRSENDEAQRSEESDNGNENSHSTCLDDSPHSSVSSGYDEATEIQKRQQENVNVPRGLEESDNANENRHFAYFDESPHRSVPLGYDEETKIQIRQKENVEVSYVENGNGSRSVAGFDERPESLGYDEETKIQYCERQNSEFFSVVPQDEPHVTIVGHPVTVPEDPKPDETHQSETENAVLVSSEESKETLSDKVEKVDVASEANCSSIACDAAEKDDDTANSVPRKMSSSKVSPGLDRRLTKPKLKPQADAVRFQKTISSEAAEVVKPRISESKGLFRKKTEKTSPRPASPLTRSGVKTSKAEDTSMNISEAKMLRGKKSIEKELRSEKAVKAQTAVMGKSLPGVRQTSIRPKPTSSPSRPCPVRSAFKSNQQAENRKEEKAASVEKKQSQKNLNFKATPLPSFYNESVRSDRRKVISTSKPPNQPRTLPNTTVPHSNKVACSSSIPSHTRPTSSASTRTRPSAPRPTSSASSSTRTRPSAAIKIHP